MIQVKQKPEEKGKKGESVFSEFDKYKITPPLWKRFIFFFLPTRKTYDIDTDSGIITIVRFKQWGSVMHVQSITHITIEPKLVGKKIKKHVIDKLKKKVTIHEKKTVSTAKKSSRKTDKLGDKKVSAKHK